MNTKAKNVTGKITKELKAIAWVTLYFIFWFGILILLKKLILIDYNIEFAGLSTVLIGSLIMAKVVLIMQYIEFGQWVKNRPTIVDILLRTFLYTLGVAVVLLLEKAFEEREQAGGFGAAITHVFDNRDIYKVWTSTIVISISLFWFNVYSIFKLYLNNNEISTLFLKTPLKEVLSKHPEVKTIDL